MMHRLHTLTPAHGSRRRRKRVGRGNASGHGTYSTRGMKGQRSRSGGRSGLKKLGMKRIIAALPKLGGFTSRHPRPAAVTLRVVDQAFQAGDTVSRATLKARGLVPITVRAVKIVATGKLTKKLMVAAEVMLSHAAREAIINAGGSIAPAVKKVEKKKK